LKWRTLDPFGVASPVLPFAIEWDSTSVHPATDAPQGCSLSELSITAHAATAIYDLLRRAAVDVPVERGNSDAIAISFFCPHGRVDLP
jgi:hypothetical protein